MRMMKKIGCCLLCLLFLCGALAAWAEENSQFPFAAETRELAVNMRREASSSSAAVGRLERGQKLTVLSGEMNRSGEIWYLGETEDGTRGYVRGDLLIPAEIAEAERAEHPAPEASAHQVIGNRNSKKYHEPHCHTLPAEKNRVYFESADEAEAKGYVHCKNCD